MLQAVFEDSDIQKISVLLKEKSRKNQYIVSDVIQEKDDQILQYVDLVMEGGGIWGIGLVGYLFALEKAGIRFLSIGGTSIGGILSLILMSVGNREDLKSLKLLEILEGLDLKTFLDGDNDARKFTELINKNEIFKKKIKTFWRGIQVIDNLNQNFGLHPGEKLQNWISEIIKENKIHNLKDLENQISQIPKNLKFRTNNQKIGKIKLDLSIIAADISQNRKVVFPQDAKEYFSHEADNIDPAIFGRATGSVPFFFHPLQIGKNLLVDGGIMSNFPIHIFHEPGVPIAPTFGVVLGDLDDQYQEVNSLSSFIGGLYRACTRHSDLEFLIKNPDYNKLITFIDTKDHNWLNFEMEKSEKIELFKKGFIAGYQFLEQFDWYQYKKIRSAKKEQMADIYCQDCYKLLEEMEVRHHQEIKKLKTTTEVKKISQV